MVNDMKYFKYEDNVVSAYNKTFCKSILDQVYLNPVVEQNIEEISKYEALGLFTDSLSRNESYMDSVAIKYMFEDTRNELLLFG